MITRRGFIGLIAALPFVRLAPKPPVREWSWERATSAMLLKDWGDEEGEDSFLIPDEDRGPS